MSLTEWDCVNILQLAVLVSFVEEIQVDSRKLQRATQALQELTVTQ